MTDLRKTAACVAVAAGLIAVGTRVETALAAQSPAADQEAKQKDKNLAAGEAEARRLLVLMDRDQNGKVSKAEFMKFMEEEFARMDKNNDGELDVTELTHFTPHTGIRR
jgi:Ca2+-binding EF-hand superfamily protein